MTQNLVFLSLCVALPMASLRITICHLLGRLLKRPCWNNRPSSHPTNQSSNQSTNQPTYPPIAGSCKHRSARRASRSRLCGWAGTCRWRPSAPSAGPRTDSRAAGAATKCASAAARARRRRGRRGTRPSARRRKPKPGLRGRTGNKAVRPDAPEPLLLCMHSKVI